MSQSPRLPPELEQEIFEIAALTNRKNIVSLLCVASRVFGWIEPILYRSVEIYNNDHSSEFQRLLHAMVTKSKPPAFFDAAVRHLILDLDQPHRIDDSELAAFIKLCTGTTHLASTSDHTTANGCDLPTLLAHMPRIERLVAFLDSGVAASRYPILTSFPLQNLTKLTHLEILDDLQFADGDSDDARRLVVFLCALPALTHLALHFDLSQLESYSILTTLLERCTRLRVLCWLAHSLTVAHHRGQQLRATQPDLLRDARLVIAISGDWTQCAALPGVPTYWDAAEELIRRKNNGAVHPLWLLVE
ncbi:hypothetical protein C8F01DRAFT_103905 [Mycena amicta]|nr:hypothetical protein C8F01DRAFT_103905 [Mycena amicta]